MQTHNRVKIRIRPGAQLGQPPGSWAVEITFHGVRGIDSRKICVDREMAFVCAKRAYNELVASR